MRRTGLEEPRASEGVEAGGMIRACRENQRTRPENVSRLRTPGKMLDSSGTPGPTSTRRKGEKRKILASEVRAGEHAQGTKYRLKDAGGGARYAGCAGRL